MLHYCLFFMPCLRLLCQYFNCPSNVKWLWNIPNLQIWSSIIRITSKDGSRVALLNNLRHSPCDELLLVTNINAYVPLFKLSQGRLTNRHIPMYNTVSQVAHPMPHLIVSCHMCQFTYCHMLCHIMKCTCYNMCSCIMLICQHFVWHIVTFICVI